MSWHVGYRQIDEVGIDAIKTQRQCFSRFHDPTFAFYVEAFLIPESSY